MGRNPVTGDSFGLAYPAYKTVAERIEERTAAPDATLGPASRVNRFLWGRPQQSSPQATLSNIHPHGLIPGRYESAT